ncbi:MAG: hypothetical protein BGO67_07180 [Alphaproteobacteria bacterium 41-28]|nr:MAG: hypothetical protein BGO67_07180 [Alphaproteobacteria bacterium 41-28]
MTILPLHHCEGYSPKQSRKTVKEWIASATLWLRNDRVVESSLPFIYCNFLKFIILSLSVNGSRRKEKEIVKSKGLRIKKHLIWIPFNKDGSIYAFERCVKPNKSRKIKEISPILCTQLIPVMTKSLFDNKRKWW